MAGWLQRDGAALPALLQATVAAALAYLRGVADRPVGVVPAERPFLSLPAAGVGAAAALDTFRDRYAAGLSGSPGPRYWGFVTGGSTPAALVGDWLTAAFDQNTANAHETSTAQIELETLHLLRQLFGLSDAHVGSFVTGATMSNFVGLALARQWVGRQQGIDVAQQGVAALRPFSVLAATPHASTYKALAMLGLGRDRLRRVAALPGREAVDVDALAAALAAQRGRACVVVASAGTVNTVDFDDLAAIGALRQRYPFWLHVDAAFGGFAAASPRYAHLLRGWDAADSICIDAHKWLNVPYDAAMQFSRHPDLQLQVFQNAAAYLGAPAGVADFVHRTPENSRRLRALPAWFSLLAYGRAGYQEIVERNCDQAQALGARLAASAPFELLAPVRLNGILFTLAGRPDTAVIQHFLDWLRDDGRLFLTATQYRHIPAVRASIVNWRTTDKDVEIAWAALQDAARALATEDRQT